MLNPRVFVYSDIISVPSNPFLSAASQQRKAKLETKHNVDVASGLSVLGPLVLAADLLLLLGGEVVGDIERLPDLLGGLALDHVGDCLAAHV